MKHVCFDCSCEQAAVIVQVVRQTFQVNIVINIRIIVAIISRIILSVIVISVSGATMYSSIILLYV